MRGLFKLLVMIVVLDDPFRGMRGWKNSTKTQQLGHTPRSGPEVKNGKRGVKYGAPRGDRMRDNPEGGELDPADDVRRRCKNFLPFNFA